MKFGSTSLLLHEPHARIITDILGSPNREIDNSALVYEFKCMLKILKAIAGEQAYSAKPGELDKRCRWP